MFSSSPPIPLAPLGLWSLHLRFIFLLPSLSRRLLSWISLTLSPHYTPNLCPYATHTHTHTQCILGFAFAAAQRDWVEAVLVNETVIYIEGGRHPLCELCVDTFVSAYSHTNNYIETGRHMNRHKQSCTCRNQEFFQVCIWYPYFPGTKRHDHGLCSKSPR